MKRTPARRGKQITQEQIFRKHMNDSLSGKAHDLGHSYPPAKRKKES